MSIEVLRTPDDRFDSLPDYPFAPHYLEVNAAGAPSLRMHYVDEGPRSGKPIIMLHGQPTWSFLYRKMIGPLAAAGYRVLATDLIGFGRSDRPAAMTDYTYARHVAWVTSWLNLQLLTTTTTQRQFGSGCGRVVAGLE